MYIDFISNVVLTYRYKFGHSRALHFDKPLCRCKDFLYCSKFLISSVHIFEKEPPAIQARGGITRLQARGGTGKLLPIPCGVGAVSFLVLLLDLLTMAPEFIVDESSRM